MQGMEPAVFFSFISTYLFSVANLGLVCFKNLLWKIYIPGTIDKNTEYTHRKKNWKIVMLTKPLNIASHLLHS